MTNEQRRLALAKARRRALEYAEEADGHGLDPVRNEPKLSACIKLADMWAHVAQCMKTGGALEADGVIPEADTGADSYTDRPVLTRYPYPESPTR